MLCYVNILCYHHVIHEGIALLGHDGSYDVFHEGRAMIRHEGNVTLRRS